jgi:hypothetical protein
MVIDEISLLTFNNIKSTKVIIFKQDIVRRFTTYLNAFLRQCYEEIIETTLFKKSVVFVVIKQIRAIAEGLHSKITG